MSKTDCNSDSGLPICKFTGFHCLFNIKEVCVNARILRFGQKGVCIKVSLILENDPSKSMQITYICYKMVYK